MEQRALVAAALVLGCVTAAGAGGYVAVRQLAAPSQAALTSEPAPAAATEGTIAEIAPLDVAPASVPEPVAPAPIATPSRGDASTNAVPRVPAPRPAPARAQEPVQRASRPASTPVRPTGSVRHDASVPAGTSASTASSEPPLASQTRAEVPEWPSRDVESSRPSAESTLPSRTPVSETSALPAPVRRLESITIPADAVVGVQLEHGVSTLTARLEDTVRARVTRDVIAGGDVVIPAGSRLLGNVTLVEEGGRVKEKARLGVRFHTLVLANGTEVRLPTETIYREGESPAGRSAAKIGGSAVGGAILGAIMGGGKGAIIGAASGAGSGTGWAMASDRKPAELRAGQAVTVRVSESVSTQVER